MTVRARIDPRPNVSFRCYLRRTRPDYTYTKSSPSRQESPAMFCLFYNRNTQKKAQTLWQECKANKTNGPTVAGITASEPSARATCDMSHSEATAPDIQDRFHHAEWQSFASFFVFHATSTRIRCGTMRWVWSSTQSTLLHIHVFAARLVILPMHVDTTLSMILGNIFLPKKNVSSLKRRQHATPVVQVIKLFQKTALSLFQKTALSASHLPRAHHPILHFKEIALGRHLYIRTCSPIHPALSILEPSMPANLQRSPRQINWCPQNQAARFHWSCPQDRPVWPLPKTHLWPRRCGFQQRALGSLGLRPSRSSARSCQRCWPSREGQP